MRHLILLLSSALWLGGSVSAQQTAVRALSLKDLEAAALRDSNDATVHYRLAMAYWDRKQWDDAERSLHLALQVAPSYAEAHLALGMVALQRGDDYWKDRIKNEGRDKVEAAVFESASHIRHAFQLNPLVDLRVLGKFEVRSSPILASYQGRQVILRFKPWWLDDLGKGVNELREGSYEKAFARFKELADDKRFGGDDRNVPDPILWYHGLAAAHLMNFNAAVRDFALLTGRAFAVERDTTRPGGSGLPLRTNDYRFIMATMLYLGNRYNEAIPTFRRALEFDLSLYEAHVQMARMYEAEGLLDSALAERRLALDADQDDPDLLVDLAETLLRADRTKEAEETITQAERINPHDARAPYLEAITADALNEPDRAREAYTCFLAIAPSRFADQIAEAKGRLATLSSRGP